MWEKYPFFTQNGNLVIDAHFGNIDDPLKLEQLLLNIPGIIANGIFSMKIDTFFKANEDGSVEVVWLLIIFLIFVLIITVR